MVGNSPRYDHTNAYRSDSIKAAKDLGYGEQVIKRLRAAKTEGEICRIMTNARKEFFG